MDDDMSLANKGKWRRVQSRMKLKMPHDMVSEQFPKE